MTSVETKASPKGLSLRAKTWLSIALFVVVFAVLVVVASFFDLQISRLLTKHSLSAGEYISHNAYALFIEALGSCPFYMMLVVAACITFWAAQRKGGKWNIAAVAAGAVAVVGFYLFFSDLFAYTAEYLGAQIGIDYVLKLKELSSAWYIRAIDLVLALVSTLAALLLWRRIPADTNKKMVWWALAIVCTMAFYLIVHFVKGPVGRVRYRAMNLMNNFDYYTPWYVINGKRVMIAADSGWTIVAKADGVVAAVASDACKSFPSGHTYSAAMVYSLLALPYVSDKCNKKGVKITLWCVTVAYTALVAIGRIVAGAHFMSDVVFGGTIAFAASMLMREIFVCKGCHFFALFPRKKAVAAMQTADNDTVVTEDTIVTENVVAEDTIATENTIAENTTATEEIPTEDNGKASEE